MTSSVGRARQLVEQHGEHVVDGRTTSHDLGQRPGRVRSKVRERAERARGEEALAPARPHPDVGVVAGLLDDRALADTGLSGQQDQ